MDILKQLNRVQIALDSYGNSLRKRKNNSEQNKKILIIFQQVFGDAVVFNHALNCYTKLYPIKDGYEITLLAREPIIRFMKEILPLNPDIKIEKVDFTKLVEDFRYYKKIVSKYRDYADIIIVPGTSLSAEILSSACNANRKVGLMRSIPVTRPLMMRLFYNVAYTEEVVPDKEAMMLERQKQLLHYLGLEDYRAEITELLPKEKVIQDDHYAVICPGSSKMEKCWPVERFIKVIDYLIDEHDLTVHLCGGKDEVEYEKQILERTHKKKKVVSHIGKISFSEWSAIIQHADIVIGNDSATIHIAAAARVPAICITGVYDKFQFFPYKTDNPQERLPVALYEDMPCAWCRTFGYDAGYGNQKCKKRIKNGQCTVCILKVSTQSVLEKTEELLARKRS